MQTPPGWYRDPTNPSTERWWDGGAWTQWLRPAEPAHWLRPAEPSHWLRPAEPSHPVTSGGRRVRDAVAVAAVLVVTVGIVVLVAVARHGGEAPADLGRRDRADVDAAAPSGAARAELPVEGTDFVERTGAYSLRVGAAWDEADLPNGIGWYTGTGTRRFRDNVTAIVEDLPRAIALDDYVRFSVDTIGRAGVDYEEVGRRDLVLTDGRPAVVLDYRSRQGGFTLGHRVVIAVRGRVAVSVTFTAEADRFDDEVGDVASHLESLQVR